MLKLILYYQWIIKKQFKKELNMTLSQRITKQILPVLFLINTSYVYSCDTAQMIDYDYQIKEVLGKGYSTFGRIWNLDNKKSCVNSLKYGACLTIKPMGDFADLTIDINKEEGTSSQYTQRIKYNSSEVIRFEAMSMNVYLKLFVSNTVADLKMSGRSCERGFPNMPRQVTREELDTMFRG